MDKSAILAIAAADDKTLIECLLTAHASTLSHARESASADRRTVPGRPLFRLFEDLDLDFLVPPKER
jgi:hypothetical protein